MYTDRQSCFLCGNLYVFTKGIFLHHMAFTVTVLTMLIADYLRDRQSNMTSKRMVHQLMLTLNYYVNIILLLAMDLY